MSKTQRIKTAAGGWPDHLSARLKSLRRRIDAASVDALLVTNPTDVRYLTDFPGDDSWAVVSPRAVTLISDSRFDEQINQACPYVKKVIRSGPIVDALADAVGGMKIQSLGIQADHLTVQTHAKLADKLGANRLKSTDGWLLAQRAVKDATELRSIRRAIALHEQAYMQTMDQIRPGMSENEVATLLEYNMRWIGGEGPSFSTIVAIGPNAALPHHVPGRTRVKPNIPILIDSGTKANGYGSDLTRVIALGGMSQKLIDVYKVVLEAQQAAIEAIRPGAKLKDVDAVARQIIDDAGYGDYFGHGLGHGIGLAIHEQPTLSPRSDGELAENNVVTVEPGVYLPGIGGVRIEDDVLVTARGRRKLTTLPNDLDSAIIK